MNSVKIQFRAGLNQIADNQVKFNSDLNPKSKTIVKHSKNDTPKLILALKPGEAIDHIISILNRT